MTPMPGRIKRPTDESMVAVAEDFRDVYDPGGSRDHQCPRQLIPPVSGWVVAGAAVFSLNQNHSKNPLRTLAEICVAVCLASGVGIAGVRDWGRLVRGERLCQP